MDKYVLVCLQGGGGGGGRSGELGERASERLHAASASAEDRPIASGVQQAVLGT